MEQTKNYKDEIRKTRLNALGSSDARMLALISNLGNVPPTALKRLAVCKGLIEQEDIPYTDAVRYGDETEQQIYDYLAHNDKRYESNPLWESKAYSRKNVKCISHPDIVLQDDENMVINVYEVKASKKDTESVRHEYNAQLYHHMCLAKERASQLGRKWRVNVYLVHYNTNGLDLSVYNEFDPSRLTLRKILYKAQVFDLGKAMTIVSDFMETFNYYSEDETVPAEYLPAEVRRRFEEVANVLREIKEREAQVDAFKRKLYDFLSEKGIKKVSCDDFSFTLIAPTKVVSVDYKRIFEDEIEAKHKMKAKRLKAQYNKVQERKGYVSVKVGNNKE